MARLQPLLVAALLPLLAGRVLPPFKVAVSNAAPVLDTWVIYELEFYFGYCHQKKRVDTTRSEINMWDSGTRRENPDNIGFKAFDGRSDTNWTADCKVALGGCKPYEAYVGTSLSGHPLWLKAMHVNATVEDRDKLNVNCIRMFQSDDPRYKADQIAIVNFKPGCADQPLGYCRTTLVEFDASGGKWTWKPAAKHTMWRITNLSPTTARWAISELRFYRDFFCKFEVKGPFISSSTHLKGMNAEKKTQDDDDKTTWVAGCDTTYPAISARPGCKTREGWIGMDFGPEFAEPIKVRCIKMTQKLHNPDLLIAEKPSFTLGIGLDRWNGVTWLEQERYYYADHFFLANETPARTMITPYFGVGPGKSEDTRPANYGAWRLSNDDWTVKSWRVHETEFYDIDDCDGFKLKGIPVSVQGPAHKAKAELAFDGDLGQDKFWESSCVGNGTSCNPEQAWFGLYFPQKFPRVRCIRIMQARTQDHTASGVLLSVWANGTWEPYLTHREIGGGCWNRRPAAPWSMWRVLNAEPVPQQWKVFEIRAYMDPNCLMEAYRGKGWEGLTSGYYGLKRDTYTNAFDSQASSAWGADCKNCTGQFQYWIGGQLPNISAHLWADNFLVRCVKYWGSPHFDEQARRLRVDVWNGEDWDISPLAPSGLIGGGGSGSWARNPAVFGSQWRLVSKMTGDMSWRFHEVELYSDSTCETRVRSPHMGFGSGGADFFVSGYTPMLRSSALAQIEADGESLFSEGRYGADKDGETSVLLDHRPSGGLPAWFGIDVLSETSWIRCVRIKQSPLLQEQALSVDLELWDGEKWTSKHEELSEVETQFTGLGGGGWQRRPAADKTMWRLENLEYVKFGWAAYEVEFHNDTECSDVEGDPWAYKVNSSRHGMSGEAIASGYAMPTRENGPDNAFDGDPKTAWASQCTEGKKGYLPRSITPQKPGCFPRDAWIGLDFGNVPREVRCVRIRQIGDGNFQSENVAVSKWDGMQWTDVWKLVGLGGTVWDQRPAFPNSMWRVTYRKPFKSRCRGELTRPYVRPWGVNELRFYKDDDCKEAITGGRPIGSGTIEAFRRTFFDPVSYSIDNAFDDDANTLWGANCKYGWRKANRTFVECEGAFVGLDFRNRAVEARCINIMQSRIRSGTCCDVASELELQRWNGSAWVEASWRHEPPIGHQDVEESRQTGASFQQMGKCLPASASTDPWDALVPEKRGRKDSDNCIVPLTGATSLLGVPMCMSHPQCAEVIGVNGQCCPIGLTKEDAKENRCCCNFLSSEAIFLEEVNPGDTRALLQIEYATIFLADTLPIPGFFMFVLFTLGAWVVPGNGERRVHAWTFDPSARLCFPRLRKVIFFFAWPVLAWRSFLDRRDHIGAKFCRWHLRPNFKPPGSRQLPRVMLWLIYGVFAGGVAPWVACGLLAANIAMKILFLLALSIKWSKSRFDPKNHRHMKLRQIITKTFIKAEDDTATAADVSRDFIVMVLTGTTYFLKFIFDLLVFRAQMISVGAIDSIKAEDVVDIMPGLISVLKEPAEVMYKVQQFSSDVMGYVLARTIGIPLCQGTCILYGSMFLVAVLVTACLWMNYDFFGLFAASRQVAKTTRPECQRGFAVAMVVGSMAITFGLMQCAMILLVRALSLANPLVPRTWMCAYDDTIALYIGRALMGIMAVGGMITFFLTVNGHFMGQDYILTPLGNYLGIDLLELDPDGVGEDGGVFRFDVFGAVLPTLPGAWFDKWNVRAFLLKERARIYAEQLHDPQPCLHCNKIHVKYNAMFIATGRQVSLACQVVPFGVIVGKLSEYLNDPPLFYWGKELPCATLNSVAKQPKAQLHRSRWFAKILLTVSEVLCYLLDYGLPILKRASNIGLFYFIWQGVFTITEENIVEQGQWIMYMGFILSYVKACFEAFGESLLGFAISVLHTAILMMEEAPDPALDVKRTVAGQISIGASVSSMTNALLPHIGVPSMVALFISWGAGWVLSLVSLLMARQLEEELVDAARMPRGPGPTIAKLAFAIAIGGATIYFGWDILGERGRYCVPLPVIAVCMFTMKFLYIERTAKPRNAIVYFVVQEISFERFMKKEAEQFRELFYSALQDVVLKELPGPSARTMSLRNIDVSLRPTGEGIPIKVVIYPTTAYTGAHAVLKSLGDPVNVCESILERVTSLPEVEWYCTGIVSVEQMRFTTEAEAGPCNKEMQDKASPASRVLHSKRWLSPLCGCYVASVLGTYIFDWLLESSPTFAGLLAHGGGLVGGFFVGMFIDKLLENIPQLVCLFSGAFVFYLVSLWNVISGVIVGVVVGTLIGSILEEIEIRKLIAAETESRKTLAAAMENRTPVSVPPPLKSREDCLLEALASKVAKETIASELSSEPSPPPPPWEPEEQYETQELEESFQLQGSRRSSEPAPSYSQGSRRPSASGSRRPSATSSRRPSEAPAETLRAAAEGLDADQAADGPFEAPSLTESDAATRLSVAAAAEPAALEAAEEAPGGLVDNCSFERDDFEAPPSRNEEPLEQVLALVAPSADGAATVARRPLPTGGDRGRQRLGRAGAAGASMGVAQPSLIVHRGKAPPPQPTLRRLRDATVNAAASAASSRPQAAVAPQSSRRPSASPTGPSSPASPSRRKPTLQSP